MLSLDTSWRLWVAEARGSEGKWAARRHLAAALFGYPFRAPETMAGLIRSGEGLVNQWAAVASRRTLVSLGGVDAHARLDLRNDPVVARVALPLPGYEASFRVLSVRVRPERPLSGDAAADGATVMRAIRAGHLYTVVDAVATPPSFEFTATSAQETAREGDRLSPASTVMLRIKSNAPPEFTTIVWNGAAMVGQEHREQEFTVPVAGDEPAAYWVEIRASNRPRPAWGGRTTVASLPWIRSNAIYVGGPEPAKPLPARPAPTTREAMFNGRNTDGWRAEHDPDSLAVVETGRVVGGADLRLRYALAGGDAPGRTAALAFDTPRGIAGRDRLSVTLRGERPMRISIQLRIGDAGDRWSHSIYVAPTDEERTIFFDDFMPHGETATPRPPLADIRSILFVIDATNAKAGDSGRMWVKRAELQN
jgi:hypothetical protein